MDTAIGTNIDTATGNKRCANRALQMLLWDIGFEYNVYPHQFEAIRFVAGLVPTFPFPVKQKQTKKARVKWLSFLEGNETGASDRLEVVLLAVKELSRWHDEEKKKKKKKKNSNNNNNNFDDDNDNDDNTNAKNDNEDRPHHCSKLYKYILPTRGMLLADEMGLDTCVLRIIRTL
mmetsp:Transcript_4482/g.9313  ORF Transcript_4482/g.9313 Transcript_4482/m.9313 type:complete len:175 (-) Transcript_4482:16-540(-)